MGYSDGGRQVSPQAGPCGTSTEKNLTAGALHVLQHGAEMATSCSGGGGGGGDGGGGGGGGGGVVVGGGKGTHALPHVKVPQGRGLPKGPTHSDNGTMNESVMLVQELSPEAKKVRCRWVALQVSLTSSAPHWGSSGKRCGGEKHACRGRWYVLQSELHRTAQTVMASMAAIAHGASGTEPLGTELPWWVRRVGRGDNTGSICDVTR